MTRVLLVVEARETLRDSAKLTEQALALGAESAAVRGQPALPATPGMLGLDERAVIDTSFAAVPIGTAGPDMEMGSMTADASENFIVRAEVPDEIAATGQLGNRPLFSDPDIAPLPVICGNSAAIGDAAAVRALHRTLPPNGRGLDGSRVAIAIMDTGINAAHLGAQAGQVDPAVVWNSLTMVAGGLTPPGAWPVNHGTMCAFDALIAAPQARLLDYPLLTRRQTPAGSRFAGTLGEALQAYAHLEAFWSVVYSPARYQYDALVINNSWGVYHPSFDFAPGHPGRYIDNPAHPFNLRIGALARAGIDIVFAAGNCGSDCPAGYCQGNTTHTIMGANAHGDVLSVAGISTDGDRIGYSSEGPPIPGMGAPNKPDLACATHFTGSGVYPEPDNGTSAASPVAAGCVAALRTRLSQAAFPPAQVFQALRTTARAAPGTGAGWNAQFGHGILDLDAAGAHFGV